MARIPAALDACQGIEAQPGRGVVEQRRPEGAGPAAQPQHRQHGHVAALQLPGQGCVGQAVAPLVGGQGVAEEQGVFAGAGGQRFEAAEVAAVRLVRHGVSSSVLWGWCLSPAPAPPLVTPSCGGRR
jgi:hypothetical protein